VLKLGFALAGAQASDLAYIVRFGMAEAYRSAGELGQRGRRRAARSLVAEYYQARLGELLERAREGLDGGLDVFVADEALTQYARAKHALAKYCWGRGTRRARRARRHRPRARSARTAPDRLVGARPRTGSPVMREQLITELLEAAWLRVERGPLERERSRGPFDVQSLGGAAALMCAR